MKNFEPNRAFNTEVAAALGIYQAILIQQIRYWQEKSTHEIDGRKWIYNTYQDWSKQLTFISERTIRRELKKLAELKIVRVAKYNISKFNHTKWYSLDEEKLQEYLDNKTPECRTGQIGQVECPREDNGNGKSDQFRTGQVDHFKDNKVPKNTSLNNQQKIKEILECFKEVTGQVFDKDKWGIKLIKERLAAGNDVEQCKSMIVLKAKQWKGTHVEKFIRPRTLFGDNFSKYYAECYAYHRENNYFVNDKEENIDRDKLNQEIDILLAKI